MEGQAARFAALGRNYEDIGIAVVFPGESDPLAVGRKLRKILVAGIRSQAPGVAAGARSNPQVAGVGEHDLVLRYIRVTEKSCRARRRLRARRAGRAKRPGE